jgi:TonB family protein
VKLAMAAAALGISINVGLCQTASDSVEQYRKDLEANPKSSLAHFRIGEIYLRQGDSNAAANEFRSALNGDVLPKWTEVWSHINLGKIYDSSGQRARAVNEYQLAQRTNDNTQGAQDAAAEYLKQAQAAGAPSVSRIIDRDLDRDTAPQLLETTQPEYSDEARIAELEGTVILTGVAGEDGQAKDLRVTQSLGLGLDEKAIETVRRWRFKPGTHLGQTDNIVNAVTVGFEFPAKQSRWHLIGVEFRPSGNASRPSVLSAYYPPGPGIFGSDAAEEGQLLGAIGRQATASVSFDVDEHGVPGNFQVLKASLDLWGSQAIAVLRQWRFTPGLKDGVPVPVPCTFDFAWGPRSLTSAQVAWLREAMNPPPPSGSGGAAPVAIYRREPAYPEEARNAGVEGTVTVALSVGGDGTARDVRVTQGLAPSIDESVKDALSQWVFIPVLLNGQPSQSAFQVRVKFELPNRVTSAISPPPVARAAAPAKASIKP